MKRSGKNLRLDGDEGRQYAALPFRHGDGLEILLISSRETRRWVIPKGWPMRGRKPYAVAEREAWEEAGVKGRIARRPLGLYRYVKRLSNGAPLQCAVRVYPMLVERQRGRWPEQDQRTVQWFPADEAALAVDEPELKSLIAQFTRDAGAEAGESQPAATPSEVTPPDPPSATPEAPA